MPRLATRTTDSGDREYFDPANPAIVYPSVTSVIKVLAKPALIGWAAKCSAQYAVDNIVELARLVETGPTGAETAARLIKGARFSGNEMVTGSAVHDRVEAYLLDRPAPALPDEVDPATVDALFGRFLEWERDWQPVYELSEAVVANPSAGYAGRVDIVCALPAFGGRRVVVDIKTGNAVYPEVALQLAAYRNASEVWMDSGEKWPMPELGGAAVLHLRTTGYAFRPVETGPEVFDAFRSLLVAWHWRTYGELNVLRPRLLPPAVEPVPEQRAPADDEPATTATDDAWEAPTPGDDEPPQTVEPSPLDEPAPVSLRALDNAPTIAELRAWAIERGMTKPGARGRLPRAVIDAWNVEHPGREYAA